MDVLANALIVITYVIAIVASPRDRLYAIIGFVAFTVVLITQSQLMANWSSLEEAFGYDGAVYRWDSAMAVISFAWWLLIHRTTNLVILASASGVLLIDTSCVLLGAPITEPLAWAISSATVVLHIAYCYGCAHGGFFILFDGHSHDKGDFKARGGDK